MFRASILASATLALSADLPPIVRSSSEVAVSGSLSTSNTNVVGRHEDSELIDAPEEIYVKVGDRRDSLGLDLECTRSVICIYSLRSPCSQDVQYGLLDSSRLDLRLIWKLRP